MYHAMRRENKILQRIRKHDRKALLRASEEHAENMVILAYTILRDPEEANVLVRDLLLTLWEQGFPGARSPLHRYLYDRVRQACQLVTLKISD